jgi:hypothetical protein
LFNGFYTFCFSAGGQMRDLADNLAETIAKLDKKTENMTRKRKA